MDLRVLHACGVYGVSVVTALTAQNTQGVHRVHRVPPRFVAEQIDAVARDLPIAAAKLGMLDQARIVEIVAERLHRRSIPNVVVDPVILAKDGTPLLNNRAIAVLKERVLPRALVVTPNVPEAEALSGVSITDTASIREAALRMAGLGVKGVVVKGGHLPGEPVDTLFWANEFFEFSGPRLEGAPVHGTGCIYASALAAAVAKGATVPEACARAREVVAGAIEGAAALGKGTRLALFGIAEEG